MSSWGHSIVPIGLVWVGEVKLVTHWNDPERQLWRPGCSAPRCYEKPEFATRYMYVTGQAGRTTHRIQYACRRHGEAFAKKYGLELSPQAVA